MTPESNTTKVLTDVGQYCESLSSFVTASPSSYHAAAELARRLGEQGFQTVQEQHRWGPELPRCGYVLRDGAVVAWMLPTGGDCAPDVSFRIIGSHTDSPALKLKPAAALLRDGVQLLNMEVYGGPLLNSFLDRELGLAGRLVTMDGAIHLVRTGPVARVAQVAPHLDRSVNDSLHLDKQANLLPLWTLVEEGAQPQPEDPERYLCELAGVAFEDLAFHDVVTYPTEPPARFGRHQEMLASSRLDNLSSVHASLVALEAIAVAREPVRELVIMVANDHEEVGSLTRSGAGGPLLSTVLRRLARVLGVEGDAYDAMLARSICVSADAGHAAHPNYGGLHDPVVRPRLNAGPLLKINAQQRYATDAVGAAVWKRACRAAGIPNQDFVSNSAVPCGTTIGPITAGQLGVTTVDVGQPLLSMHSQRELCGVQDGAWMAQAMRAFWLGA
ncbi:M18 family aminopeptidase [Actinomyces trachealis]|uniref:M18 family aminopeptidase n=1 Tax=Actinomyces trachealis TaxID=2763540 RepID=UPI0018C5763C|nr:M18 family aminopeptidase [Actinomyces trachealis]